MGHKLTSTITSYDLLKTFAVIIMIIDHLGVYGFVDSLWMRSIGRIGFPVWFFLVGYARGRDIPRKLWGGALILLIANMVVGMPLLPANALVTIIMIRVVIDIVAAQCMRNYTSLFIICAVLTFLILPSYLVTEYGTQALITALYGYFVRHKKEIDNDPLIVGYMIFSFVTFVVIQQISFEFTVAQCVFMALGTLVVRIVLLRFGAYEYPELTAKMPASMAWFTRLCGRRTLEIYVGHLLLFKLIALGLGFEGFDLFSLRYF